MNLKRFLYLGLLIVALIVAACSPQTTPEPTVTPTPVPTATPEPTVTPTPVPTATPLPTATPRPTATAPPTATPLPTATPSPTPLPLAEWVEEGDALLQQSDFAGAEAAYRRVIEAEASYSSAYAGLSRVYLWQTGREDDALAQAQKAVELAPDSAVAYAVLARAQAAQKAPGEAVAAGEQAVELDEKSATAQAALARAYLLDRQYEAARQAAEQAVTLDPELAKAYHSLGRYYRETADFARARAAFEQAIALEPTFAPWHVTLGHLWALAEDYDRAIAHFQQALELAPDYVPAILGLAYAAMEHRDYEEAEAQIQRAIELVPDAPDAYVAWGYLHLEQDESDEALAQFRQALAKRADDWHAQVGLGEIYIREEECDSATRQFQDLMVLQPRFAIGRVGMGFAKLCSEDVNKALEYFRKALELEPYSVSAQMGLGTAYSMQGRWEETTSAYVQALRLDAIGTDIHTYLAVIFMVQGETDPAKAEYQVALQLNSDSIPAHIGLGELLLAEDRDGEAQAHAEQALSLDATDQLARRVLGISLVAQGKAEEGIEALEQVIEEEPENALAHFWLGLAYRDLGQYTQAKKELETCLALGAMDVDWQQVSYLIEALEQGYIITEDKAVSDLAEFLELFVSEEINIGVEQIEGEGRTLVISLAADPESEQDELVFSMIMAVAGAAYMVPRIDPPVENGVLARVEEDGQPISTMKVGLSEMKGFFDGVISDEEFVAKLQFSRAVAAEGPAPVEEIEADLSETRELSATTAVPYHPLTPEGLQEKLTSSIDAQVREEMRASESLLTLLGVIEPDVNMEKLMADIYTEQIAGFYDPEEKTFYVLEGEEQTALDQMVIAHEYTHALQDLHFGLEELTDESLNSDQLRAFDALVEGDATLAMSLYAVDHIPAVDLLQSISRAGGLESEVLNASPTFIQGMLIFPYGEGLVFVTALYDSGGWAAVDRAYEEPPQSTEQVLHPERYREGDEPQAVSLPDLAAGMGGYWQEVETDVLGELGLRLALAQHVGPAAAAMAAEGWAGDRYALLQQGTNGQCALVMRTYWDDQSEADEFWALYRVYMAHRTGYTEDVEELVGVVQSHWWLSEEGCVFVRQEDRHVTIILGPDEETVGQVLAALESS